MLKHISQKILRHQRFSSLSRGSAGVPGAGRDDQNKWIEADVFKSWLDRYQLRNR